MPESDAQRRQIKRGVEGNYALRLKLGESTIPSTPPEMQWVEVSAGIDRFLPSIDMSVQDAFGIITHLVPADRQTNNVTVGLGDQEYVEMKFDLYRRKSQAENVIQSYWSPIGLLQVPGLFTPSRVRTFRQSGAALTVKAVIEKIAEEMDLDHDVSPDLNFIIENLYQPSVPNHLFLRYLSTRLKGFSGTLAFYCFVIPTQRKPKLIFLGIEELLRAAPSVRFVYNDSPIRDLSPAYNLQVMDNYAFFRTRGTAGFDYGFFDWDKGSFETVQKTLSDINVESLSRFYLVDQNDSETDFYSIRRYGRTNEFQDKLGDFEGQALNTYLKRLNNLVQIWIDTDGDATIWPGQVVNIYFPSGQEEAKILAFQYSGSWLVSRVVHHWQSTYHTRLLLIRPGVDTSEETTLVRPNFVYTRG